MKTQNAIEQAELDDSELPFKERVIKKYDRMKVSRVDKMLPYSELL